MVWRRQIRAICRDNRGSFTVEAGIIFPAILCLLLGLVILGAYLYQRYDLFDTAVYVSTQRAATWDNSRKVLETGALPPPGGQDNLYWRLFEDHQTADLAKQKLAGAGDMIRALSADALFSKGLDSNISYQNIPKLKRQVIVKTGQKSLASGNLFDELLPHRLSSVVASQVVEPAEYIRNADLLASMGGQRMVVSSINSNIYHYPECPRSYDNRIKDKNFQFFCSEAEAVKSGKVRACLYCQRLK